MALTCPKCKFEQEDGEECLRCGIVFHKYKPLPAPGKPVTSVRSLGTGASPDEPPLRLKDQEFEAQASGRPLEPKESWLPESEPAAPLPSHGLFRRMFRILPWISLAAGLVALYLMFQQAPPLKIQLDPRAWERVDRKMHQLHIAAQTRQPYTMSLDEAELNAWLHSSMSMSQRSGPEQIRGMAPNIQVNDPKFQEAQSAMKDLRVKLSGDQLRAYAVFDFHGRNLSLLLGGRVYVRDGYLRLDPTEGKIGSLPIPTATLNRVVQRLFDSPENRQAFQLSPQISSVDIRHGQLFVAYR